MEMTTEMLEGGVMIVTLAGRLDILGAQKIDLHFSSIAGAHRKVIVDLEKVDFLASLGIRTLILGAKSVRSKGGRMVLLRPQPEVEKVILGSGTDTVIPVLWDLDAAIAAMSA
jgi:anti-sigma B factor antagonist